MIVLMGLVAAVAVTTAYPSEGWGEDEDFGPSAVENEQLGNSSNGSNGTNSTTSTTVTTVTTTTVTTTTTLPKYDFINMAFFKVGEAEAPGFEASAAEPNATNTTTPKPFTPKDSTCSINAPGQKAYYAKLARTGCNCTAMPAPPRGWESWAGIHWHGHAPHYMLTMATPTFAGNEIASFHAFCNPDCSKCNVKRSSDAQLPANETCASQEPIPAFNLKFDECNDANEAIGESFFVRQPAASVDQMGDEFCVLTAQAAAVEGAFTVVEYPASTDCDANGTSPLMREGAMVAQTYPAVTETAECREAYDGSHYKLSTGFNSDTNETFYDGVFNCLSVDAKPQDECLRAHCDYINDLSVGKCASIETKDVGGSYSMKIIGSGDVSQCFVRPASTTPNPDPTPAPSKGKGHGVAIGGAIAGVAVFAALGFFVMRKRRMNRAQAYSVLQGSAYTEN